MLNFRNKNRFLTVGLSLGKVGWIMKVYSILCSIGCKIRAICFFAQQHTIYERAMALLQKSVKNALSC